MGTCFDISSWGFRTPSLQILLVAFPSDIVRPAASSTAAGRDGEGGCLRPTPVRDHHHLLRDRGWVQAISLGTHFCLSLPSRCFVTSLAKLQPWKPAHKCYLLKYVLLLSSPTESPLTSCRPLLWTGRSKKTERARCGERQLLKQVISNQLLWKQMSWVTFLLERPFGGTLGGKLHSLRHLLIFSECSQEAGPAAWADGCSPAPCTAQPSH